MRRGSNISPFLSHSFKANPRTYKMGDNNEDPWLAPDKLYHVLFCLSLTLLFSKLASLTRYPFLKRHSIRVGAILSLFAGAAKEAADQIGLFPSAGASAKDAVADIIGVLIAAAALSMLKSKNYDGSDSGSGQTRRVLPIWWPIAAELFMGFFLWVENWFCWVRFWRGKGKYVWLLRKWRKRKQIFGFWIIICFREKTRGLLEVSFPILFLKSLNLLVFFFLWH